MLSSGVAGRCTGGHRKRKEAGGRRTGGGAGIRLLAGLAGCLPLVADAHIKWFATVDLHGTPRSPFSAFAALPFALLAGLALAVMMAVAYVDARLARRRLARFDLRDRSTPVLRYGMAVFFIALACYYHDAPVVLTPDLKSDAWWLVPVQLAIALAAASGASMLAGLGITFLYAYAMATFGVFHLLDYPIFIGLAFYLCATAAGAGNRPGALAVLRFTTALSLMWGGVEKWLYPEWTFPLLCGSGRALLMGFTPDFFMQSAGFIEFCAAFTVLVGGIAARIAAVFLISLFAVAIPMFGMVDAIGHAPFLLSLVVLALNPNPFALRLGHREASRNARHWAMAFACAVGGLPLIYYSLHQVFYGGVIGTSGVQGWGTVALLAALPVLLLRSWRLTQRVRAAAASGRNG